jgi:hypothetical protein
MRTPRGIWPDSGFNAYLGVVPRALEYLIPVATVDDLNLDVRPVIHGTVRMECHSSILTYFGYRVRPPLFLSCYYNSTCCDEDFNFMYTNFYGEKVIFQFSNGHVFDSRLVLTPH